MCGRGRAGVRQERTAQYGGRMFVFAATQWVQGDRTSRMGLGLRENPGGNPNEINQQRQERPRYLSTD